MQQEKDCGKTLFSTYSNNAREITLDMPLFVIINKPINIFIYRINKKKKWKKISIKETTIPIYSPLLYI